MKCIWEIKFEQLHEKTTSIFAKLRFDGESNEGRRQIDPFLKTIKQEIDDIVSTIPKGEVAHGTH